MKINTDFPGGNIVFESQDGDDVYIHQDLRDTDGDWFYWYFEVSDTGKQTLRFNFTQSIAVGTRGPAVSADEGVTWHWGGRDSARQFTHTFDGSGKPVRFCFSIPYLQGELEAFLKQHANHPSLGREELCRSRKGRGVELITIGRKDAPSTVLLTARHHCCEMIANHVLEGIMETVLEPQCPSTQWLADDVLFLIVPFADKDGVEDGDQGKNRRPHDHNRDYIQGIYPETVAIRQLPKRVRQIDVALDLHCPWIAGEHNEQIYMVGSANPSIAAMQEALGSALQSVNTSPLPYSLENHLPFGEGWNVGIGAADQCSCSQWSASLPGIRLGTSVEIPYANAGDVDVSAENARLFGHDLAKALALFMDPPG